MKALFFKADRPYADMGDLLQIIRNEAAKILCAASDQVKVLNILYCPYPKGYIAVVQNSLVVRERKTENK